MCATFFGRFLMRTLSCYLFFFFNDTATTEIYTLSLHDALPIYDVQSATVDVLQAEFDLFWEGGDRDFWVVDLPNAIEQKLLTDYGSGPLPEERSEEHTSELQSHLNLVCRLLLEKKKKNNKHIK